MDDTGTFSALPQEEQQELEQTLSQNREQLPAYAFLPNTLCPAPGFECISCLLPARACHASSGSAVAAPGEGNARHQPSWHALMIVAGSIAFSDVGGFRKSA